MAKTTTINVNGLDVAIREVNSDDYISLTDMAKSRNNQTTDTVIQAWLKRGNTLRFIEIWEQENNPSFNPLQMQGIKLELSQEANFISVKQLVERANIIGIESRRGRYHSGTFAHRDIAFEFATWLSPEFKYYLIKEFQRLKEEEAKSQKSLQWDYHRFLTKVNYRLQTDTIRDHLIPRLQAGQRRAPEWVVYAEEADLLNMAVFGMTAKEWREENPDQVKKGNIRDSADVVQLTVLANLESLNAVLIEQKMDKESRFQLLANTAISQYRKLSENQNLKRLE